ncbi:hypothetical protein BGZ83_001835, partial [Gryganskiella cystojenkinii]
IPQQLVFGPSSSPASSVASNDKSVSVSASNVFRGEDAHVLFQSALGELDRGLPGGWEGLVQPPNTGGTRGIDLVRPETDHLEETLLRWSMDERIQSQALADLDLLVKTHAQQAVYVSQRFSYNVPGSCHGGERPVCMFTLIVVARAVIPDEDQAIGEFEDQAPYAVEVHHLYVQSSSSTIQQTFSQEECHRCWLRKCCHWRTYSRDMSLEELNKVQATLSTHQAWWGYNNIPSSNSIDVFGGIDHTTDPSRKTLSLSLTTPSLQDMLREFVQNPIENQDVFKVYDQGLLAAIQRSIRSSQQQTRNMRLSLKEKDLMMFLNSVLNPCLNKAGMDETGEELWHWIYDSRRPGDDETDSVALSFECESLSQAREQEDPPSKGCGQSSIVDLRSNYVWVVVSTPRTVNGGSSFDAVYSSSTVHTSYLDCEPLPEDPETDKPSRRRFASTRSHCVDNNYDNDDHEFGSGPQEGSIVRLSELHPDGSFAPVHYLVLWSQYPVAVNKAALDMVRYASAASFLKIPMPNPGSSAFSTSLSTLSSFERLHQLSEDGDKADSVTTALASLNSGAATVKAVWDAAKSVFGRTVSESVQRKICLGFAKYEHEVTAMSLTFKQQDMPEAVDAIMTAAKMPKTDELRAALLLFKFSDNFTWTGEMAEYTSTDGRHHFFFMYKYLNEETDKVMVAFGVLQSDFVLAPDVLVVTRKESRFGGMSKSEEVIFRNVPHVLTPEDIALLTIYFEVVAYRKLALVTHSPVPEFPDMKGLCDL